MKLESDVTAGDPAERPRRGRFVRRKEAWVLTWRGWLAFAAVTVVLTLLGFLRIYPFLAASAPLPEGFLVVEGWCSDSGLESAAAEFRRHPYSKLLVTGGPIERGSYLLEFGTYAHLGAATLLKLGLTTNEVQVVPAGAVIRDRTYAAATALSQWLSTQPTAPAKVHLLTEGPHARRSWLLYERALGSSINVGVTALPVRDYDPHRWWRSSLGVRSVIDETVAYLYARFLFHPAAYVNGASSLK